MSNPKFYSACLLLAILAAVAALAAPRFATQPPMTPDQQQPATASAADTESENRSVAGAPITNPTQPFPPIQLKSPPKIIAPSEGATLPASNPIISGSAPPNALIFVYVDPGAEPLGINTYANGGAGLANAQGSWEVRVAEACSPTIRVVVAAVAAEAAGRTFWNPNELSSPVTFAVSGKLPSLCRQ